MTRALLSLTLFVILCGCSQEAAPTAQPANNAQAPGPLRKAAPGVGEKGKGLGVGPVSTPIKAYFRTKETIAFDIQMQQALQLHKASTGKNPKDHDEFMRVIIQANRIQLPELPAGEEYFYNPDEGSHGTLFVRPAP